MTHNVPAAMAGEEEDGMARTDGPQTEAGQRLMASEGVLALFIGAAADDDHVLLDFTLAIEAEARAAALLAVEEAVKGMAGIAVEGRDGTWLSVAKGSGPLIERSDVLAAIATLRHSGDGE